MTLADFPLSDFKDWSFAIVVIILMIMSASFRGLVKSILIFLVMCGLLIWTVRTMAVPL